MIQLLTTPAGCLVKASHTSYIHCVKDALFFTEGVNPQKLGILNASP